MRSPEPASNNATLAVVGRFKVEGIRRFVRENYYPHIALSLSWAEVLDEYQVEKRDDWLAIGNYFIKVIIINKFDI